MGDVKLNPRLGAEIANSEEIRKALQDRVDKGAEAARAEAPFDPEDPGPHYRDSIVGEVEQTERGFVGRIVAGRGLPDDRAIYIELGTEDTPTFAPLLKAAESLGEGE